MPSAHAIYQRHLRKQLSVKAYAVWPPGRVLEIGDIGELGAGGDFQKRTDLEQLGIAAEARRDVSVSLEKLGDVQVKSGDLGGARKHYEESLAMARVNCWMRTRARPRPGATCG